MERLWQKYFNNPMEWWDDRKDKRHPNTPDFRHKRSKEALWIDSSTTPPWVILALQSKTSSKIAGANSFKCLNSSTGGHKQGNYLGPRSCEEDYWTAFMHTKCKQGRQALVIYKRMCMAGVKPSSYTFTAALKACSSLKDLECGKEIHAEVVKYGFDSNVFVGTMLLDMYAKCGSIDDARSVFEKMPNPDVVSWNAMILAYAQMEQGQEALQLFSQMRQAGVALNARTFVGVLKACGSLCAFKEGIKDEGMYSKNWCLGQVRGIHAVVVENKCQSDLFVGNVLVDTYAKCGSLIDARFVFERMPHRDVVSWNAMISGYSQMGEGGEALQLYERMQQEGVVPDDRTFVSALKACVAALEVRNDADLISVKKRCVQQVQAIHSDILRRGSESAIFVGTTLVDVYAKCDSLMDARCVFEKMPRRDTVSWNAMILGYAQMDNGGEALLLYRRMQQEGVVPNDRTFVSVLKACSRLATSGEGETADDLCVGKCCAQQVKAIHSDIVKTIFVSAVFVGNSLVDAYCRCGDLVAARCVFDKMPHRNVVSWATLISGYAQSEEAEDALHLYTRMQEEGLVPDTQAFAGALKACSRLATLQDGKEVSDMSLKTQCLERVRAIHSDILKSVSEVDLFVGTMLVDAYAKCGSLVDARHVFEKLPYHDTVAWTAMILAHVQMEEGQVALELYTKMQQEGFKPDQRLFVGALKACSSLAASDEEDNVGTKCAKLWCLQQVRAIHSAILENKFELDVFVGTMLVDAYAKCGSIVDALSVFEKMPHRDVVSWNALIMGYAQQDEGEVALRLYRRMQAEGVVPNGRTICGALRACSSVAALERGKDIHAQILKCGLQTTDPLLARSLIDMYSKCGSIVAARQVFDALPTKDVVTWSALIAGYARRGESECVFDLYDKMRLEGVQPNGITFLSILTACSHVGQVEKGQEYFTSMRRDHGIAPKVEHYNCMVDLFGRAGQVHKAMEIIKTMPFQAPIKVWRCLLAACQKWNNLDIGRQAFEHAVTVDGQDAAAYVLMSNIYTGANMWEEAKEIQAMRVKSRAWKQPGCSSWTDMGGIVHAFFVRDQECSDRYMSGTQR